MSPPDSPQRFTGPLITANTLHALLAADPSGVTVIDVRWSLADGAKRDDYRAGHLPGAVFADLDTDLSSPPSRTGGRHPLPDIATFASTMRRLGVRAETPVVAYDDASGAIAARLWWMLDCLGHPVAVLDGGLASWPGSLSTETPTPPPGTFTATEWPEARFVDADTAVVAPQLIDARAADRFAGPGHPVAPRPGHIPGARNAPWADNLAEGRFLPADELADHFRQIGLDRTRPVVAYCGSGVTACHDLLALRQAGFDELALYVGSWSAWGADSDRPAETASGNDTDDPS
ncbi:MAG: sulfurtransferase [Acidimicrobiales bacterium]|nr:sulfurtransferase [Acidimicrobiales bacterium]